MTALTISRSATTAMQVAQFIRNGKAPTADIQNQLATMVGYAAKVLAKPLWRSAGELVGTGGTSLVIDSLATRPRWRFPLHTSPYHWYLMARFEIAPQNNGSATSPSCRIDIANTANTVIGSSSVYGGSSGGSYADVPINMTGGTTIVLDAADPNSIAPLVADTEYTGVFWDVGYARLMAASIWEVTLEPNTDDGYAANNHSSSSPIYSSHRDDVAAMARLLHKRSGVPVFHWCSNVDSAAPVQASAGAAGAAAVTLGALTVSATGSAGGTGDASITLGALTVSATGTSASFDVSPIHDVGTAHSGDTITITAYVSAEGGGGTQTNGHFKLVVSGNDFSAPNTVTLDSWTMNSEWSFSADSWSTTFSKASITANAVLVFTIVAGGTGTYTTSTGYAPLPGTDQVPTGTYSSYSTNVT